VIFKIRFGLSVLSTRCSIIPRPQDTRPVKVHVCPQWNFNVGANTLHFPPHLSLTSFFYSNILHLATYPFLSFSGGGARRPLPMPVPATHACKFVSYALHVEDRPRISGSYGCSCGSESAWIEVRPPLCYIATHQLRTVSSGDNISRVYRRRRRGMKCAYAECEPPEKFEFGAFWDLKNASKQCKMTVFVNWPLIVNHAHINVAMKRV